ncbi:pentapeptide repeat-containing protein [Myxococcota bacterium]|nr:pentapeptide repeat-containing protein [Myxococcota bacterium]
MSQRPVWSFVFLVATLFAACGDIAATNPYDPATPEAQQAQGTLRATFTGPLGFALRGVARATLSRQDGAGSERTEDLRRVEAGGVPRLLLEAGGLVAGPYRLTVVVEGLMPIVDRPLVMVRGGDLDLGEIALAAPSAPADFGEISGSARRQGAAPTGHEGIVVRTAGAPWATTTEGDGTFRLAAPAGTFQVTFSARGYGAASVDTVGVVAGETTALSEPVVLPALPGRIRGRVTLPAAYADADRLARVEVTAVPLADVDAPAALELPTINPAADGGFLFDGVTPGRYAVQARLPDWDAGDEAVVRVEPGDEAEAGVLAMPAPALDPEGGARPPTRLEGVVRRGDVLDADGHGGILVEALRTPHATVTTGAGRFVLEVPPEALTLRFSAPGYGTMTLDVPRPEPETTTVLPSEIVLTGRPGAVTGTVTLSRFGTPATVVAVTVRLLDAEDRLVGQTSPGEDGRFVLPDVTVGAYAVEVAHPGYVTARRGLAVGPGETVSLGDVSLPHASETNEAVSFAGRILLAADEPLAGTRVRVRFADRDVALGVAFTAPDGRFEVPAAAADAYVITVERAGFTGFEGIGPYTRRLDGTWADPEGAPLELTLAPVAVNGRIEVSFDVEPAWLPAEARVADVTLRSGQASWPRPGVPGDPAVVFDGLAAGDYGLRAARPGFEGFEATAALRFGAETVALAGTVRLVDLGAAGLSLSGQARTGADFDGIALAGADLSGVQLTGSLAGRDLRGANLAGAQLDGLDLTGARLDGANLSQATLNGAQLADARLDGANLAGAVLSRADLTGATLDGARLFGADLSGATLIDARLVGAQLVGADLTDADLSGADLTAANLSGAVLVRARFAPDDGPVADPPCDPSGDRPDVRLGGVLFSGADLREAHLRGAALAGVDFGGALLNGTDLRFTCLTRAAFALTDLSGALLDGADARGAGFTNAVAVGASFIGADLHGARFAGAVLEDAVLVCRDRTAADTCACPPAPSRDDGGEVVAGAPPRRPGAACRAALSAASLDGAALLGADFSGAALPGASLLGAVLAGTNMTDADLSGALLAGVDLGDTRFRRARLDGVRLAGARVAPETDLTGASLAFADLSAASAVGARLRAITLDGADLGFAVLSGADLRGASLVGARLVGTNVTGAFLSGADLSGVRLLNTDLDSTADVSPPAGEPYGPALHLPGADLSGRWDVGFIARHPGSNLDGAVIGGGASLTVPPVGLIGVSLRGAVFSGDAQPAVVVRATDGERVRFNAVDLSGADLTIEFPDGLDLQRVRAAGLTVRTRMEYRRAAQGARVTANLTGWSCGAVDVDNDAEPENFSLAVEGSDLSGLRWFGPLHGLKARHSRLDGAIIDEQAVDGQGGVAVRRWDLSESSAVGLDLAAVRTLDDASFRRVDATGFVAPRLMQSVRFYQTDLRGADFANRSLTGLLWRTSDLRDVDLSGATVTGSCLDKTQNAGASWARARLNNVTLRQLDLRGVALDGTTTSVSRTCESFPADRIAALFPNGPGIVEGVSGTPPFCGSNDEQGVLDPQTNAWRNVRAAGPTSCYEGVGWPGVSCWSRWNGDDGDAGRERMYSFTNATRYAGENTPHIRELFRSGRGINAIELVHRDGPNTPGIDSFLSSVDANSPLEFEAAMAGTLAAARLDTATLAGRGPGGGATSLSNWSLHGASVGSLTIPANAGFADVDFSDFTAGRITGPPAGTIVNVRRGRFTPGSATLAALAGTWPTVVDVLVDGADWAGRILPNANISRTSLVGARLAGAALTGSSISESVLRDADLANTNFTSAVYLADLDLSGADLSGAQFAEARLEGLPVERWHPGPLNLRGSDLTGVNLNGAAFGNVDLSGTIMDADTRLSDVRLEGVELPRVLRGMTFDGATLAGVEWQGRDLRGASLVGAQIRDASWADVVLVEADLSGATLTDLDAEGVLFVRADLRNLTCTACRLRNSDFAGAHLAGADLSDATLFGSDFSGADLRGATLPPAALIGDEARFDGARLCAGAADRLTPAQAAVAVIDPGC